MLPTSPYADDLMTSIYSTAARAIVDRERRAAARARVRWTPAAAIDLDNARISRANFITGSAYDRDELRVWRAALIEHFTI